VRGGPRGALVATAVAALLVAGALACDRMATNLSGGFGPEAGVLRGKLPSASRDLRHAQRLTDGIAAEPGDPWRTDLTAVMSSAESFVTWDLGADVPVRCVLVEGDGNDTYVVSLSKDGQTFAPLWTAGVDEDRGQQLRAGRDLQGTGRYLRVTAAGGDGQWSLAEVSAWSTCPKAWPPLAMQHGASLDQAVTLKLWVFETLALVFIFFYRARMPDWAKLLGVVPAGIGISLGLQLADLWPLTGTLSLTVPVAAGSVAVVLVLRIVLAVVARARAAPPPPASP
jgi:hypothetical protein